ncbi:hypothetical protein ABV540_003765 [Vibrio fluvialis]
MRDRDLIKNMMDELDCKGKRVTPDHIKERITDVEFKTIELCGTKMMFCGIAMRTTDESRPFVVTGRPSVCIDPENWREQIGQQVSYDNAFDEIYKLEAYRMMTTPTEPERIVITKRDHITLTFVPDCNMAMITIGGKLTTFLYQCSPKNVVPGGALVRVNGTGNYNYEEPKES